MGDDRKAEPTEDTVELDSDAQTGKTDDGQSPFRRGDTVGRYVVLDELGAGAMGVVYTAFDPELDRKVALKMLAGGDAHGSSGRRTRLVREAQAQARLNHPSVVTIYDVGTVDEHVFLAMELIDGTTLKGWLAERKRTWRQVLSTFVRAGRGLAAAHSAELIHRDFKPDNVLIGRDGKVCVADFGLARILGTGDDQLTETGGEVDASLTRTGTVLGTPRYMAPEQHAGKDTDPRTDEFSFCVTLYEALYGEHPFDGESPAELAESIANGAVRDVPSNADVPSWLRRVVLRGMANKPAERYATMDELLAALGRDPALARRRWLAIGGVSAILGAFVVAAVLQVGGNAGASKTRCANLRNGLTGAWDAQVQTTIEDAFTRSDTRYAATTWTTVRTELDEYADAWLAMKTSSCRATVDGEQTAAFGDLRTSCLDQRLMELRAVTGVLAKADDGVVRRSVKSVHGLSDLRVCTDKAALEARFKPAASAEDRATVIQLRKELARVKALEDAGKLREAVVAAADVAARAVELKYRPLEAEALYQHASVLDSLDDWDGARLVAIDATVAASAAGHGDVEARAWNLRLYIAGQRATHDEAKEIARYAGAVVERIGDRQHQAQLLNNIGIIQMNNGELEDASNTYEVAVSILEAELGPDHPQIAVLLNNQGTVFRRRGQYVDAERAQLRGLTIREKALGVDHPDVAESLTTLGNTLNNLGRYDEAAAAHLRAKKIWEHVVGPRSSSVADTLNNLGNALKKQGKYVESEASYMEAISIYEETLGPDHPDVATVSNNMASVRANLGKYDEALADYQRAKRIWTKQLGAEHANIGTVLNNMARVQKQLGHTAAARNSYLEAARIWRKSLSDKHPYVALSGHNLADMDYEAGHYRKALAGFEKARAALTESLGADHLFVAHVMIGKGRALVRLKQPKAAVDPLEKALVIAEAKMGEPKVLGTVRFALAEALWDSGGDKDRARRLAEQAKADLTRGGPEGKPDLVRLEAWLRVTLP